MQFQLVKKIYWGCHKGIQNVGLLIIKGYYVDFLVLRRVNLLTYMMGIKNCT